MNNPRRDRERKLARRNAFKQPLPTILVVCEGEKSEPQYFLGLIRAYENPRVTFQFVNAQGVPLSVVQVACEMKRDAKTNARREGDSNIEYNEVWCLFDVDDHPNIPEATVQASDNGIELAISNPSFELWLLLHFRGDPGPQHRDEIYKQLKKYVPGYKKSVDYFKDFHAKHELAVSRAEMLDTLARRDNDNGRNPTTGAYRLAMSIISNSKTAKANTQTP